MVSLSRSIMISAPRDAVRQYLHDLANAAEYEPKLVALEVGQATQGRLQAQAAGRFLGLPWRGSFEVQVSPDGGYTAEMVSGPLRKMSAVYKLRSVPGGTVLTHEEHYPFSLILRPIVRLLSGFLVHALERELQLIKEGAERVNRRQQLAKIESAGWARSG